MLPKIGKSVSKTHEQRKPAKQQIVCIKNAATSETRNKLKIDYAFIATKE